MLFCAYYKQLGAEDDRGLLPVRVFGVDRSEFTVIGLRSVSTSVCVLSCC